TRGGGAGRRAGRPVRNLRPASAVGRRPQGEAGGRADGSVGQGL
ncbi:MAG: hypothetical protein AVDCRST_MAG41-3694, partial [uncultured Corynebacteriales bacterium]